MVSKKAAAAAGVVVLVAGVGGYFLYKTAKATTSTSTTTPPSVTISYEILSRQQLYQSSSAITVPVTIQYSANVKGGVQPYSYLWNLGISGVTSTSATPSQQYTQGGAYTITLTVTDAIGEKANASITLDMYQPTSLSLEATAGVETYNGTMYNAQGTDMTFVATLTSGGNPMSGQTVSFYANSTLIGTATTNSSGQATLSGVTSTVGSLSLQALFAGNVSDYIETSQQTLSITVVEPLSVSISES